VISVASELKNLFFPCLGACSSGVKMMLVLVFFDSLCRVSESM